MINQAQVDSQMTLRSTPLPAWPAPIGVLTAAPEAPGKYQIWVWTVPGNVASYDNETGYTIPATPDYVVGSPDINSGKGIGNPYNTRFFGQLELLLKPTRILIAAPPNIPYIIDGLQSLRTAEMIFTDAPRPGMVMWQLQHPEGWMDGLGPLDMTVPDWNAANAKIQIQGPKSSENFFAVNAGILTIAAAAIGGALLAPSGATAASLGDVSIGSSVVNFAGSTVGAGAAATTAAASAVESAVTAAPAPTAADTVAFTGGTASDVGGAAVGTSAASTSSAASAVESAITAAPAPTAADTVAFTGGTASDVGGAAVGASAASTSSAASALESVAGAAPSFGQVSSGMTAAQMASTVTSVIGAAKAIQSLTNPAPGMTQAQQAAAVQPATQNTGGLTPDYKPMLTQLAIPALLAVAALYLS